MRAGRSTGAARSVQGLLLRPLLFSSCPASPGSHAEGDPCQNGGLPCPPTPRRPPLCFQRGSAVPCLHPPHSKRPLGPLPAKGSHLCPPACSSFNTLGLEGGLVLPLHPARVQVALVMVAFASPEHCPPPPRPVTAVRHQQPPQAQQPFLAPCHASQCPLPCPNQALQTPGKHSHGEDKPGPPPWFESQPCPSCQPS